MRKQDTMVRFMSESNQQVHIQTGHEKAIQNGKMHAQGQINKFTYSLELKAKWNGERHSQSETNKLTYFLEMRRQDRMVRGIVRVKSIHSHTVWK